MTECHPSDSYSAPHIDIRTPKKLCRDSTARLSPSLQDYKQAYQLSANGGCGCCSLQMEVGWLGPKVGTRRAAFFAWMDSGLDYIMGVLDRGIDSRSRSYFFIFCNTDCCWKPVRQFAPGKKISRAGGRLCSVKS